MSASQPPLLSDAACSALAAVDDPESLAAVLPFLACSQSRVPEVFCDALERHGLLESCWRDLIGSVEVVLSTDWLYRFGEAADAHLLLSASSAHRAVERYLARVPGALSERDREILSVFIAAVDNAEQMQVVLENLASSYRRMSGAVPGPLVAAVVRRAVELDLLDLLAAAAPVVLEAVVSEVSPAAALALLDVQRFAPQQLLPSVSCPNLFGAVLDAVPDTQPELTASRAEKIGCFDPAVSWGRFDELVEAVRAAHGDAAALIVSDEVNPSVSAQGSTCLWLRFSDVLVDLRSHRPPSVPEVVAAVALRTELSPHLMAAVAFSASAAHPGVDPHPALREVRDSQLSVAIEHAVAGMCTRRAVDATQAAWALRALLPAAPQDRPQTLLALASSVDGGLPALTAALVNSAGRFDAVDVAGSLFTFGLLSDEAVGQFRSSVLFRSPNPFSASVPRRSEPVSQPTTGSPPDAGSLPASSSLAEMVGRWLLSRIGATRLVLAAGLASDDLTADELAEVCAAAAA